MSPSEHDELMGMPATELLNVLARHGMIVECSRGRAVLVTRRRLPALLNEVVWERLQELRATVCDLGHRGLLASDRN
ncbi:MAG TPA: hypothetical protein VEL76_19230 [Gemmataceae bacterium]|nr:hypothetical protein [Gemmataceae bacterium]